MVTWGHRPATTAPPLWRQRGRSVSPRSTAGPHQRGAAVQRPRVDRNLQKEIGNFVCSKYFQYYSRWLNYNESLVLFYRVAACNLLWISMTHVTTIVKWRNWKNLLRSLRSKYNYQINDSTVYCWSCSNCTLQTIWGSGC